MGWRCEQSRTEPNRARHSWLSSSRIASFSRIVLVLLLLTAKTMTLDASVLSSKRVVYVGGLADQATADLLRAAMIPFGPIKSVELPMDYAKGKHRGFAFVEYEEADDAEEAIFNLHGSELLGRTIKVSLAQPNQVNKLSSSNEAVWKSDEWFKEYAGGTDEKTIKEQHDKEKDARILQED